MSRVTWGDSKMGSNFKKTPMHTKIMKLNSKDPQKRPKWGPNRYLRPPNSWKSQKCKIYQKTLIFVCFSEVQTSQISKCSFQKSPKIVPASQDRFLTPRITQNIKKWAKSVPHGTPQIHPNSRKIIFGTPNGPPACHPCTKWPPKWRQSDPSEPQHAPKMVSQDV